MRTQLLALTLGLAAASVAVQGQTAKPLDAAQARRAITLDDHSRIVSVGDPQRSPDGQWVAYTVTTIDAEKDRRNTDIWMIKWDGTEQLQLTSSSDNESTPRWSPDNKYLAFVASRGTEEEKKRGGQIWLLNRAGGEAHKVSDVKGGVSDIQWSPDSTRIAFTHADEDPRDEPEKMEGWKRKTAPPIVIDRYHFKQDRAGYLGNYYSHIGVFDVTVKTHKMITRGNTDDVSPSWSPDGKLIAFLSKRGHADPDRTGNEDLWLVDAEGAAEPRQLTRTEFGEGGRPAWSPDGSRIALLQGDNDSNGAYSMNKLIVVPSNPPANIGATTRPTVYMPQLDRAVSSIAWSADGQQISFLLQDDRTNHLATVPAENPNGAIQRRTSGRRVISSPHPGRDGNFAVIASEPNRFNEIFALENGNLRQLTKHNDRLLSELQLASTEDFTSKSKDGTQVNGLIVKPAGYKAGTKYPTLLIIHGGPNGQDQHAFSFDREFLAANGYVVLAINYRGSAGRGNAFQKSIHADWGNLESQDLIGAVDEAIKQGIADPARLGIGGWSYGGISTDHVIARDQRFRAAVSGAGVALVMSLYGVDQYILQYDNELGHPWKSANADKWMRSSYPFFNVDKIKTPTLFMGGEKDFNVPIAGGEQMYQALKSLGVDTQLVIYPGQFHGLSIPSYERDRLQRYLNWFNKYLQPTTTTTASQ
ncbi:MAG TPA: S9 family peptidase [Vicinamibacterales bacterium]|nr:S9 family peptidase [Vicinamibacterales bacterium]